MNKANEEGVHSINVEHKQNEKEEKKRLGIDKKKLVIYSEIMKPKFDEGLD